MYKLINKINDLLNNYIFFSIIFQNKKQYIIFTIIYCFLYVIILNNFEGNILNWLNGVTISIIATIIFEICKNYNNYIKAKPLLDMCYSKLYRAIDVFFLTLFMSHKIIALQALYEINCNSKHPKTSPIIADDIHDNITLLIKLFKEMEQYYNNSKEIKSDLCKGKKNEEYETGVIAYEEFRELCINKIYPFINEDFILLLHYTNNGSLLLLFYKLKNEIRSLQDFNLANGFRNVTITNYHQIFRILDLINKLIFTKELVKLKNRKML